jgi:hypothetical protein
MKIELHDPEGQIMKELSDGGFSQASVAITYAFLLCQEEGKRADWHAINAAIQRRWKGNTALTRVKKMAWQHVAERRNRMELAGRVQ